MGGIGAVLSLLSFLPTVGQAIALIGVILILTAVKSLSDISRREGIFKNYLIAFILGIITSTVFLIGIGASIFELFRILISSGFESRPSEISFIGTLFLSLLGMWILGIIEAFFIRKSFIEITEVTGIRLFKTAGTLNLVGAILAIILVGIAINFIGSIITIVAFFSLPERL